MVMNVSSALSAYQKAGGIDLSGGMGSASKAEGSSFSDTLTGFMSDAIDSVRNSEKMATQGVQGKADMQDVILAVNDAEMTLQTIVAIRDKVVSAYQEILNTPI